MSVLHQQSDGGKSRSDAWVRDALDADVRDGYLARSRNNCQTPDNAANESEWWGQLDYRLLSELQSERARWQSRAEALRDWDADRANYAQHRARSLGMDASAKLAICGKRRMAVRCGCKSIGLKVGCGQRWLCEDCRRDTYQKTRKRLLRACRAHTKAARRKGNKRRWVLVTLTCRHTGDLRADRRTIVEGWRKLRQWLHHDIGQFPYAMTWEATEGTDGLGHVHAHVVALWPWVDWSAVAAEWRLATGGKSSRIHLQSVRKGGTGAANYLAKYVSKGVQPLRMTPKLAAQLLGSFYGKRIVSASRRFYVALPKECRCCGEPWRVLQQPPALATVDVAAVWDSHARRMGVGLGNAGPPMAPADG